MIAFGVIGGHSILSVAIVGGALVASPSGPWLLRCPRQAQRRYFWSLKWVGNAARTIVKITRLLGGGLGAGFAHDRHRGA